MACCALACAAQAENASIRLGVHFRDAAGYPMQSFGSLAEVLQRLNLSAQLFAKNVENCQDLIAIPPSGWHGYDTLRNTDTIIQSIRAECWAILQLDHNAQVSAAAPTERITPEMIYGIMANADRLSAADEKWRQTLTAFPGGVIICKDEERCLLALPDGKKPPDESVLFELILAKDDERYILVTQLHGGQAGFVYGVQWRETNAGSEVVAIFPKLR